MRHGQTSKSPRLLRELCLTLSVVELSRRRLLIDNWRGFGTVRLFNHDPDDEDQPRANVRSFISGGGGILKVSLPRGGECVIEVTSRQTAIPGYRQWLLTCGKCGRACRKLLVPPIGVVACAKCVVVRYPDQRRQRSMASVLRLAAFNPGILTRSKVRQEGLRRWAIGEFRRLGLTRGSPFF
jgi:hypothetical protein